MNCAPKIIPLVGFVAFGMALASVAISDEVGKPTDAPAPRSPKESRECFRMPPGYELKLVASEPLVREPTGVCWDERGALFVCELHGYNLEGQYDVDDLNKQGIEDHEVRRVQANDDAKRRAELETYGTIKLLSDREGDGQMDEALVWADRLPPCHGICPARGGIIATCTTQVLFLADEDNDGRAERRDVLFEGFPTYAIERAINAPQWGLDHWIYMGRGHGGATIQGPGLTKQVALPSSDFRIRADGSAIEPILGGTHTVGHAFSETGERFVVSTQAPAIWIAPFETRYLERQPYLAIGNPERNVSPTMETHPISAPHPWRTRRANDPGFAKFYTDRYGVAESAPNGYFTSGCSPLIYQDNALSGLKDSLLVCEPAQNLIHRLRFVDSPENESLAPHLEKPPEEEKTEFLSSKDSWFHPISLAHAPDGSIYITDFYREIIEDYSAIPRYLQQQYGLINGSEFGRIWKLTKAEAPRASGMAAKNDLASLTSEELVNELGSSRFWRRRTAQRLLVERNAKGVATLLQQRLHSLANRPSVAEAIAILHTLDGLGELRAEDLKMAFGHAHPGVRIQALRLADPRFNADPSLLAGACQMGEDASLRVVFQLALSLGESREDLAVRTLKRIAIKHGDADWFAQAVVSSLRSHVGEFLVSLLNEGALPSDSLIHEGAAVIARRRDSQDCEQLILALNSKKDPRLADLCLESWLDVWKAPVPLDLGEEARQALRSWSQSENGQLADRAKQTIVKLSLETEAERATRISALMEAALDTERDIAERTKAIESIALEDDLELMRRLSSIYLSSTPTLQRAISTAFVQRRRHLPALVEGLESGQFPAWGLSAIEREQLLQEKHPEFAERLAKALQTSSKVDETIFKPYREALSAERDLAHGAKVFREKCANCHLVRGVGHAVGPDLLAEFQRAEETIVKDVLAPSASITAGFGAFTVLTNEGRILSGLIVAEGPSNLTIRQPGGKEEVVLKSDIEELKASSVSLMPDQLSRELSPKDLADVITWLKQGR